MLGQARGLRVYRHVCKGQDAVIHAFIQHMSEGNGLVTHQKPASQSCACLMTGAKLEMQSCMRFQHMLSGQVYAVLYRILFCSHLVVRLCIAHTRLHIDEYIANLTTEGKKQNSEEKTDVFSWLLSSCSHLVMRLCVAHAGLGIPPVGESVDDVAHVPLLIPVLAQDVNPLVCNGHLQPVVKAHATLCYWPAFIHPFIFS